MHDGSMLIAAVDEMPAYIGATAASVNTDYMYRQSRLIAALTDAHFGSAVLHDERYFNTVMNRGRILLNEYGSRIRNGEDPAILKEANPKITDMVKSESIQALTTNPRYLLDKRDDLVYNNSITMQRGNRYAG